jgi:ketosteroid isomerase-like protein
MSQNLDLVRSIVADWEAGDYSAVAWADPEIEYCHVGGPAPGSWTGLGGMAAGWREVLSILAGHRVVADQYRELDDDRVLVLFHLRGRAKASGVDLGQMHARVATLFQIRDGTVVRLVNYLDVDSALTDLGVER